MDILARVKRLLTINLSTILEKAENPEAEFKLQIKELEKAIEEARHAFSQYTVSCKKIEVELQQAKRLGAEWALKAEKSLKMGCEDMTRKALEEKLKTQNMIQRLVPVVQEHTQTCQELKQNLLKLHDQHHEAELKLNELQTRQHAVEAQRSMHRSLQKADVFREGLDFDKYEDHVMQQEVEMQIQREMQGTPGALD